MNTTTRRLDFNSLINQTIKDRFVGINIYCNLNSMICEREDYKNGGFFEEIENYFSYPELSIHNHYFEGGDQSDLDEKIEEIEGRLEKSEMGSTKFLDLDNFLSELNVLDIEPQEIFEWWAISRHLHTKLKERGEPVWDDGSMYVWGRCTTGQAISLDYGISVICSNMEILDGQEYSWKPTTKKD